MPAELTEFSWHGARIALAGSSACAFALEECAVEMATDAKGICAVVTGTLQRSYRTAPLGYSGEGDQERAAEGEDLLNETPQVMGYSSTGGFGSGIAGIEVGSWVDYACVEEQRNPALGTAMSMEESGPSEATFIAALAAEDIFVVPV
jgi:hypothetical protein